MRIGILKCDSTNIEFRRSHGNYPEMFISIFKDIDKSFEFKNYDVQFNQYPISANECDAYLITGSRYSVYDKEDWIEKLEKYVRELNKLKFPLIGICFGHQIIAKALGGKTELAPQGWGVGVQKYNKIVSKSWFIPVLNNFSILASHQDQVTKLPVGAELLAGSDFCPYASFLVENHILTFQGHPEFTKSFSKDLMVLRKKNIGEYVFAEGIKSLEKTIQSKDITQCIVKFLRNAIASKKPCSLR